MKYLLLFSILGSAHADTIYGADNNRDIALGPKSKTEASMAVAAMIDKQAIRVSYDQSDPSYNTADTLGHSLGKNLCSSEKWAAQKTISKCTGFLIAPETIITAGHCVVSDGETVIDRADLCRDHYWVFDFKRINKKVVPLRTENLFNCKKVQFATKVGELDYAIIKLDRPATGRKPLEFTRKRPKRGSSLYAIHHPLGTAMKYTDHAQVTALGENMIGANLDTFRGSSGAPVFDYRTNKLVGMVISGEDDYVYDRHRACNTLNRCDWSGKKCTKQGKLGNEDVLLLAPILKHLSL